MRIVAIVALAAIAAVNAHSALADEPRLVPFIADYDVKYGNLSAGSSRTELRRASLPDQWQFESRTTASGLARLIMGGTIVQRSIFQLEAGDLRPLSYRYDDGEKGSESDVSLDFDWAAGRVKGISKAAAVDIEVEAGLQDAASMQALVLLRLNSGAEPGLIAMIEKDEIKYYRHTLLRHERLKTALGVLDTFVYRSARDGSSREMLLWYAPALGNVTVQAIQQRRRDGKKLLNLSIKSYRPGS
ncbi:MAG: hypothetical protein HW417_1428 [Steroidobacteraceae bacterium]|nr:hypothetical protein [Steroidobacteraceae bacterium]